MKNIYIIKKQKLRDEAIEWQNYCSDNTTSYDWLVYWEEYFEKYGRRYGLLKEFRGNGII